MKVGGLCLLAVSTAHSTICERPLTRLAKVIPVRLEQRERLITPFAFVNSGEVVIAGVVAYGPDPSHLNVPSRVRTYRLVVHDSQSQGQFINEPAGAPPRDFVSFSSQPDWVMVNWQDGLTETYDLTKNFRRRFSIAPKLLSRDESEPSEFIRMPPNKLVLSSREDRILASYPTGDCIAFDAKKGKELFRLFLDPNSVLFGQALPEIRELRGVDADFSADGSYIVTIHQWGAGAIWKPGNPEPVGLFTAQQSNLLYQPLIRFSRHDNIFATRIESAAPAIGGRGDIKQTLQFWRLFPPESRNMRLPEPQPVQVIALNAFKMLDRQVQFNFADDLYFPPFEFSSGQRVVVGTVTGKVQFLDFTEPKEVGEHWVQLSNSPVLSVAVSSNGNFFAAGAKSGEIVVGRLSDRQIAAQINNKWPVVSLSFSPDGKWLMVQTRDPKDTFAAWNLSAASKAYLIPLDRLSL